MFTVSAVESFVFLQEHVSLTIGNYQILILSPVIVQCFQVITDLVTQMDAGDFNQVWNTELLKITCLKKSLTTVSTPDHSTISSFGGCLICDPSDAGQPSSVKKMKYGSPCTRIATLYNYSISLEALSTLCCGGYMGGRNTWKVMVVTVSMQYNEIFICY